MEMFQLFAHDLRHGASQLMIVDVSEQQVHRRPRCLFLAMGMVDQDFVETDVHLSQPALGRWGLKAQHRSQRVKGKGQRAEGTLSRTELSLITEYVDRKPLVADP